MTSLAALMFISVPALIVGMVITAVLLVADICWNVFVFFRDRQPHQVSTAAPTD